MEFKILILFGLIAMSELLKAQSPPATPLEFNSIGKTDTTLTLRWKSAETKRQTFLIEVNRKVLGFEDSCEDHLKELTITNLKSETEYRLRLRSRNDIMLYSEYPPWVIARTEPDVAESELKITRYDETTVVVDWSSNIALLTKLPDAMIEVNYTARQRPELVETRITELTNRKLSLHVLAGSTYTFDLTVYDGDTRVFQRLNMRASKPTQVVQSGNVILTSVVLLLLIALIAIVAVLAVKYCRRKCHSETMGTTNGEAAYDNPTFRPDAFRDDENMYNIPKDGLKETQDPYLVPTNPKTADYVDHVTGNTYALVGEINNEVPGTDTEQTTTKKSDAVLNPVPCPTIPAPTLPTSHDVPGPRTPPVPVLTSQYEDMNQVSDDIKRIERRIFEDNDYEEVVELAQDSENGYVEMHQLGGDSQI